MKVFIGENFEINPAWWIEVDTNGISTYRQLFDKVHEQLCFMRLCNPLHIQAFGIAFLNNTFVDVFNNVASDLKTASSPFLKEHSEKYIKLNWDEKIRTPGNYFGWKPINLRKRKDYSKNKG